MTHATIVKATPKGGSAPLQTGWDAARARLTGLPGGGLNIAHEAVDRHVAAGHGAQPALIWLGREGERRVLSYGDLAAEAARFAHVLRTHGIAPGERMFLLSGRVPALYAATLGALKAGVVVSPLFAAFGPEPVRARMEIGQASVLVTTEAHYRRKIADWRSEMLGLKLVLIIGDTAPEGCVALGPAMAAAPDKFETVVTAPEDMALLHFTSGTTGLPKGVVHVHQAVVAHAETGRLGARPAARRYLLVHCRSGMGNGNELRHHLAPLQPRDDGGGRGRVRPRPLVFDPRARTGAGLVHRAHRHPHDDAGRRSGGGRTRFLGSSIPRERGRTAER